MKLKHASFNHLFFAANINGKASHSGCRWVEMGFEFPVVKGITALD